MTTEIVASVDPSSHTKEAEGKLSELVKHAKELAINTQEDADAAGKFLKETSKAKRQLEEQKKELRKPFNDGLKKLSDAFQPTLDEYDLIVKLVKGKISDFIVAQEKLAEENRKAAEAAAEKERLRLAKLAEKAEQRGDESKAEEFRERAVYADVAVIGPATPKKISGVRRNTEYDVTVTSTIELANAVAGGTIPPSVLDANVTNIKKLIKAYDGNIEIPGVAFTKITKIGA